MAPLVKIYLRLFPWNPGPFFVPPTLRSPPPSTHGGHARSRKPGDTEGAREGRGFWVQSGALMRFGVPAFPHSAAGDGSADFVASRSLASAKRAV